MLAEYLWPSWGCSSSWKTAYWFPGLPKGAPELGNRKIPDCRQRLSRILAASTRVVWLWHRLDLHHLQEATEPILAQF